MKLFDLPHEKGSEQWRVSRAVLHDHTDMYKVKQPRIVHVRVRPGKTHHQQLFVLKHAR